MQQFKNILYVMEHREAGELGMNRAIALAENNQSSCRPMVNMHEERIVSLLEPYRGKLDVRHSVLMGTAFLEIVLEQIDCFVLAIKTPGIVKPVALED